MDGMLVYYGVTPPPEVSFLVHLGGERRCGAKFLVQGNNATTLLDLEPAMLRSEVMGTNHRDTMPPQVLP